MARTSAASSLQLSVCQMPNSFSRKAGAFGRCAACSSRRPGKVGDTIAFRSKEAQTTYPPRALGVSRNCRKKFDAALFVVLTTI